MGRFDRYMLSQVLVLFGFFALVLILIYWINQAVRLFDQLIAEGQSAGVFFEITSLTLPSVISIVLPMAAIAASIYVTNRLMADSELTVVQATGYSAYRLARPIVYFGLFVTVLMMVLVHILVPVSGAAYAERRAELSQNVTARFLTEGRFMSPADNVTLYIREITPTGELRDIFLSDAREPDRAVTYTAEVAYLVRSDAGPQLVMIDGLAQNLITTTQNLSVTRFNDFSFDISSLIDGNTAVRQRISTLSSFALLNPTQDLLTRTNTTAARVRLELHARNGQALLAVTAAVLGFSALLIGGFSRFGVWRQVLVAVALAILIKIIETAALNAARAQPEFWMLPYVNIIVGLGISWFLLFWSGHPYLFRRAASAGGAGA